METTSTPDASPGPGEASADGLGLLLHDAAELAHELLLLPSPARTAFLEELYAFMAGLNRRAVEAVAPSAGPAEAQGTAAEEAAEREAERLLAALAWQLWRVVGPAARAGTAAGREPAAGPGTGPAPTPAVAPAPPQARPGGEGDTADRAPGGDGPGDTPPGATEATDGADSDDSVDAEPPAEPAQPAPPTASTESAQSTDRTGPTDEEPAEQDGQAEHGGQAGPEPSSEAEPLAAFTARLAAISAAHPDLRHGSELRNDADTPDPAGLWLRLHLAVLKIPAERVAVRRAELTEAALLLDVVVEGGPDVLVPALPGVFEEAFVVPLDVPESGEPSEADRAEVRTVLDDAEVPEPEEARVLPWAVRIAQARRLLAVDRTLGGYAENNVPWSRAQAERLPQAWTAKLSSLSKVRGAATVARSAQKLDATLGRLCHEDPAQRGSWWWEWRSRVSALLEAPAAALGRRAASPEEIADWNMEYWAKWCTGNALHRSDQARTVLWVLTTPLAPPTEASERGRLLLGHAPTGR
ncbi:hypothetical protein ACF9IK_33540 [Kitasatospora hibisci]|uniref:hypothetical protein n=1 Tax=Kitasatospora hibisci TaxID=3369522 RepID=UPI0037545CD6